MSVRGLEQPYRGPLLAYRQPRAAAEEYMAPVSSLRIGMKESGCAGLGRTACTQYVYADCEFRSQYLKRPSQPRYPDRVNFRRKIVGVQFQSIFTNIASTDCGDAASVSGGGRGAKNSCWISCPNMILSRLILKIQYHGLARPIRKP